MLREQYATSCATGLLACHGYSISPQALALQSFVYAEAMILERAARNQQEALLADGKRREDYQRSQQDG
jgi:hypothetical protein